MGEKKRRQRKRADNPGFARWWTDMRHVLDMENVDDLEGVPGGGGKRLFQ